MFLTERLELDVENCGNQLIGWIGGVLSLVAHYVPDYPPPLPMLEKRRKSERRRTAHLAGGLKLGFSHSVLRVLVSCLALQRERSRLVRQGFPA